MTLPQIVLKPVLLQGAFSSWSAMSRDEGVNGDGAGDGVLTRDELKTHIKRLIAERDGYSESGADTTGLDFQINHSRELYSAMVDAGASGLQYLPDELMSLPARLRARATDLLLHDDPSALGKVDQFVIDAARNRYGMLASVPYAGTAASKAKSEIDELALALGLE
ncbi:MAG: hypothetical protein HYV07_15500 [Deltaproteobacteria bacterium]|nr:hypothetical protein [Deltaproteobacteria bacterium]